MVVAIAERGQGNKLWVYVYSCWNIVLIGTYDIQFQDRTNQNKHALNQIHIVGDPLQKNIPIAYPVECGTRWVCFFCIRILDYYYKSNKYKYAHIPWTAYILPLRRKRVQIEFYIYLILLKSNNRPRTLACFCICMCYSYYTLKAVRKKLLLFHNPT